MAIILNPTPLSAPILCSPYLSTLTPSTVLIPVFSPTSTGGLPITKYVAVSSPGGFTSSTNQTGTMSISGLSLGQSYTFNVTAYNAFGSGPSATTPSIVTTAPGSQLYTTAGSYTFLVPSGVNSVSVVSVGGGGASNNYYGCGCLAGGNSYFSSPCLVLGGGGGSSGNGGTYLGDGGGNGGNITGSAGYPYGGTGAGGYTGNGGGIVRGASTTVNAGSGGGGGAGNYGFYGGCFSGAYHNVWAGGGGGGVGLFGLGCNGSAGSQVYPNTKCAYGTGGGGGSGGGSGGKSGGYGSPGCGGSAATGICGLGTGLAGARGYAGIPSGCCYKNSIALRGGGSGGYTGTPGPTIDSSSGGGGGGAFGGGGGTNYAGIGGGGGGLGYKNNISITTSSYTVVVGVGGRAGYNIYTQRGSGGGGASGAVRIVWPGNTRQFPSTCVSTP